MLSFLNSKGLRVYFWFVFLEENRYSVELFHALAYKKNVIKMLKTP